MLQIKMFTREFEVGAENKIIFIDQVDPFQIYK